ncbi:hypothetical protein CES87_16350 [Pseudomonas sp. ERMR1:02]|nr:hypothetical protein CES87_16350 [Pseudomonas sp. ERMR1:02]
MIVNDNAKSLKTRGDLRFFASDRASTGCSYNRTTEGCQAPVARFKLRPLSPVATGAFLLLSIYYMQASEAHTLSSACELTINSGTLTWNWL